MNTEFVTVKREALERWRDAFAEELSAYDLDPPLHHVKTSHEEITAALEQPWVEPVSGWKLCPIEPTPVMVDAGTDGGDAWINENRVRAVYKAMLEEAPHPAQQTTPRYKPTNNEGSEP